MWWIGPAIVHRKVCIIQVIRWSKSGSSNSRNIFHFRFFFALLLFLFFIFFVLFWSPKDGELSGLDWGMILLCCGSLQIMMTSHEPFGTISTPELFSFAHDWGREELWGTLKQASFSLVFARNKEYAHEWLIKIKSLLNALLCERRLLQISEEGKAFCF